MSNHPNDIDDPLATRALDQFRARILEITSREDLDPIQHPEAADQAAADLQSAALDLDLALDETHPEGPFVVLSAHDATTLELVLNHLMRTGRLDREQCAAYLRLRDATWHHSADAPHATTLEPS